MIWDRIGTGEYSGAELYPEFAVIMQENSCEYLARQFGGSIFER
jgi:hypothetical protein